MRVREGNLLYEIEPVRDSATLLLAHYRVSVLGTSGREDKLLFEATVGCAAWLITPAAFSHSAIPLIHQGKSRSVRAQGESNQYYSTLRNYRFSGDQGSDIRGAAVYGECGNKLGNINDVIFESSTAEIRYVVIDIGGLLRRRGLSCLPISSMSQSSTQTISPLI